LARPVESVSVIRSWPAKVDFLTHGSRGAPVVPPIGVGRTVLENGAATVGRKAPGEPLPIGKGFEAFIPVELSGPSRETMRHGFDSGGAAHTGNVIRGEVGQGGNEKLATGPADAGMVVVATEQA
jgi:hypothetical protein